MFGIGMTELMVIMVIALIVIGPSKLPDLARALGKAMAEFRKATQDISEGLHLDGEFQKVKGELIDSIHGIEKPFHREDPGQPQEKETPYKDFDEMVGAREKEKNEGKQEKGEWDRVSHRETEKDERG